MSDDLDQVRRKWTGREIRYTERMVGQGIAATIQASGFTQDEPPGGIIITILDASIPERVLLTRCAEAPSDVQTLGAALDKERELTGELTREAQRLGREQAELLQMVERAETARKAWTGIGSQMEAMATALRDGLEALVSEVRHWHAGRIGRQELFEAEGRARKVLYGAATATPLLAAAQRIVHTWKKLGECEEEFERDAPEACAEWRDALDDTIAALKELLEGPSMPNVAQMSPPGLVIDIPDYEKLGEGGEEDAAIHPDHTEDMGPDDHRAG